MQQSKVDEEIKAGQTPALAPPAPAARRFVEFTLFSSTDGEATK
jgi:hypothetical protein